MSESNDRDPRLQRVPLSDEAEAIEILSRSVLGLWDVVNNLTRLRASKRNRYRVAVFGSARVERDHWVFETVRDLAVELTKLGCDIITGGGPGLMEAANEGVRKAGGDASSVGIRIQLEFEQATNPYVTEGYEHRTFFSRLHHFMLVADATIVVPGGIGTLLEMSLVWQLLQVKKMGDTPLILMGDMWRELIEWGKKYMLRPGFELASAADFEIPRCTNIPAEAVNIIRKHREEWLAREGA